MARNAGGIISIAVVVGAVTAYLLWKVLHEQAALNVKNWQDVVVASQDIPPKVKITRDMLRLEKFPQNLITETSFKAQDISQVVDRTTQTKINAQAQIRSTDLLLPGESPTLSLRVPPGMRGLTIGGNEVTFVAGSVQVGDHVDILASYTDPHTKQMVTRMILQNVLVLMVNRADDAASKGALSSMTLSVRPEQTELLKAAERSGTMSVALRSTKDDRIVKTGGYNDKLLAESDEEESVAPVYTNEAARSTPISIVIQQPAPRLPRDSQIKVLQGDSAEKTYNVNQQPTDERQN